MRQLPTRYPAVEEEKELNTRCREGTPYFLVSISSHYLEMTSEPHFLKGILMDFPLETFGLRGGWGSDAKWCSKIKRILLGVTVPPPSSPIPVSDDAPLIVS